MRTSPRRTLVPGVVTALLAVLLVASGSAPAAADDGGSFVSWTNSARASAGRPAYGTAADLTAVAASWAAHLAASGTLAHNPSLRTQVKGWRFVGENVGVGPVASDVQAAFMASPTHRSNILDSDFTQIGVATATGGGRVWVVEVFRRPTVVTAAPSVAPTPSATTARPTTTVTPSGAPSSSRSAATSAVVATPTTPSSTAPPAQRTSTPGELLRRRVRSALRGPGATPAPDPVAQAMRFASVMDAIDS